ncbi:hypothetical protein EDB92DRAFT_1946167 [Lactarius akahatsu]|uniref:Uncharacterized protein n=1 Tax=Lactarius akahatsu TaxID=416441 RepID=A0AAD4LEW8_9AGAM|nr:hypothetical protein EDB92DRAFT_1946167 [Lactarius akahatsu]
MHESIARTQFNPTIDPKEAFANQTYRSKVVLISGASRGIGHEAAITYAKTGAKVTLMGRSQETLDDTAAAMRRYMPFPLMLRDPKAVEAGAVSDLNQSTRVSVGVHLSW